MINIQFFVHGIPRPGGSKTASAIYVHGKPLMKNGRVITTTREAGKYTKDWRNSVAYAAREVYDGPPLTGLLSVMMVFYFPRPKSHFRSNGALKESAPVAPGSKPDVLKCGRSTEDALSHLVWHDDSATVDLHLFKRYAERPGAMIMITDQIAGEPAETEMPELREGLFAE